MKTQTYAAILILILTTSLIAVAQGKSPTHEYLEEIKTHEETLIDLLQNVVIPPAGTGRQQIDDVFGKPIEVNAKDTFRITSKETELSYTHMYELLPPHTEKEFRPVWQDITFRVRLYVRYDDGKAMFLKVNHSCVNKTGRYSPSAGEEAEMERQRQGILMDLLEVHRNYSWRIKKAQWNN